MDLKAYYDQVAQEDLVHYQPSSWLNRMLLQEPLTRFVRRQVQSSAAGVESIADIGCGDGTNLLLALHTPGEKKAALVNDISAEMIKQTETRIRETFPHLRHMVLLGDLSMADVSSLPTYALVMCLGVINHLQAQLPRFLDNVTRLSHGSILLSFCHEGFVLSKKVGGAFQDKGLPYRCLSTTDVGQAMERLGARCVETAYHWRSRSLSPLVVMRFQKETR